MHRVNNGHLAFLFTVTVIVFSALVRSSCGTGSGNDEEPNPNLGNTDIEILPFGDTTSTTSSDQFIRGSLDPIVFVSRFGIPDAVGERRAQEEAELESESIERGVELPGTEGTSTDIPTFEEIDDDSNSGRNEIRIYCNSFGSVVFRGRIAVNISELPVSFSMDTTIELNNCDGTSGELEMEGEGIIEQGIVEYGATLTGELISSECNTSAPELSINLGVTDTLSPANGSISGSLVAQCDGVPFSCDWIDTNLFSQEELLANCN